jgi:hypothetical protein
VTKNSFQTPSETSQKSISGRLDVFDTRCTGSDLKSPVRPGSSSDGICCKNEPIDQNLKQFVQNSSERSSLDTSRNASPPSNGGLRGDVGQVPPFPCLYSGISTEIPPGPVQLSAQHRRTAFVLKSSVELLSKRYGINVLGFLTLTFSDHVICPKEAQKRLNSLLSHVVKKRYKDYVGVFERQKSGRIHYHFLVVLAHDIRTGVSFDSLARGDYRTAGKALRSEWAFWRSTARKYRFGRTELLPVKSTIEAMAKYVGKYISKHIESRKSEDRGVRLVRYSRGARAGTINFQFQSEGSIEWRHKVAVFAEFINNRHPSDPIKNISDFARVLGPRWAYWHRDFILSLP